MERITFRTENGIEIKVPIVTAMEALYEYENFMEQNNFNSIAELKGFIKGATGRFDLSCKNTELNLKERIILYRNAHKLSRQEFAEKCGVSKSLIDEIETERVERKRWATTIAKIEKVLEE